MAGALFFRIDDDLEFFDANMLVAGDYFALQPIDSFGQCASPV
jgi:hypothetical protein